MTIIFGDLTVVIVILVGGRLWSETCFTVANCFIAIKIKNYNSL